MVPLYEYGRIASAPFLAMISRQRVEIRAIASGQEIRRNCPEPLRPVLRSGLVSRLRRMHRFLVPVHFGTKETAREWVVRITCHLHGFAVCNLNQQPACIRAVIRAYGSPDRISHGNSPYILPGAVAEGYRRPSRPHIFLIQKRYASVALVRRVSVSTNNVVGTLLSL